MYDILAHYSNYSYLDGIYTYVQLSMVVLFGEKEHSDRVCIGQLWYQWGIVQCIVFAVSKSIELVS
jgi:hypothetical protein